MKTIDARFGEERLSWIGLLFGLWPFIFLGPLMAIAPYLPHPVDSIFRYDSPLLLGIVFLSMIAGIIVGWRKGFPRWVYPYLVILFFAIAVPLLSQLGLLLGPYRLGALPTTAILLGAILGLGGAALFLLSRFPPTRSIYQDIHADWTRLSFGMVVFLAFAAGFYGGDHPPPFGPVVWLPSIIVVLGAFSYLLCRRRWMRSLVLLATLLFSILGRLIFPNDDIWSIWAGLLLVAFIFLPALVGLFPRPRILQADGK